MLEQPKQAEENKDARTRPGFLGTTFASLKYRDYALLWLGQTTHGFAIWMDMIAQPLLVLALTGSGLHLGMVLMARTIPGLALFPLAGAMADRFNRRTVLLLSKISILVITVGFAALIFLDAYNIWTVYAYAILRGVTMSFDMPARRAMIPNLVPRNLVTNAMALSTWSMTITRIAGAAGSGLLIAFAGFDGVYAAVSLMYIGAVFFTWVMRLGDHRREGQHGMRSMGGDMLDGLKFVWGTPPLKAVVVFALGYFTFGMAFMQVFAPLFATQESIFGIGDKGFGFMMSVSAIGGTIGALGLAAANPQKHRGLIMIGMLAVFGVLLLGFAGSAQLGSVTMGYVFMFLLGLGQSNFHPLINAVAVEESPEEMRGRAIGVISLDRATITLGGVIAGALAQQLNPVAAQAFFGLVCLATAAVFFLSYPTLRKID